MQINHVHSGVHSDLPLGGKRGEPASAASSSLVQNLAALCETPAAMTEALGDLLSQYDVTDITPRELSEMLQKMHKNGLITEEELQDFSLIRVDLERDQIGPDDSVDLVDYYTKKLATLSQQLDASETADGQPSADVVQRRLAWLEKIALIQASPDQIGLDAVA